MKSGQIVTIAEGDYAGKQGKIVGFSTEGPVVILDGEILPRTIPKEYISLDDEVKRIWMICGEETRPKPTSGMGQSSRTPAEQPMFPRARHFTKQNAMQEMEKLAKAYPNKQFYLMESVADLIYQMELTKKERIYD